MIVLEVNKYGTTFNLFHFSVCDSRSLLQAHQLHVVKETGPAELTMLGNNKQVGERMLLLLGLAISRPGGGKVQLVAEELAV